MVVLSLSGKSVFKIMGKLQPHGPCCLKLERQNLLQGPRYPGSAGLWRDRLEGKQKMVFSPVLKHPSGSLKADMEFGTKFTRKG